MFDTFEEKAVFTKDTNTRLSNSTIDRRKHVRRRFFEFFDSEIDIAKLKKTDFEDFRAYQLNSDTLSPATVAGTIQGLKTVFNWAVDNEWLSKSPLAKVSRGSFRNPAKDEYHPKAWYYRLLECCPCLEWRVIISLARIGGLRCPSEVIPLKWEDIHWDINRFDATCQKTASKGKGYRYVPLFKELREELETLFFSPQSEGKEYVINRYRDFRQNLGTQFQRIAKMEALPVFVRPFDNMRASRSNEVYAEYGAFYESAWIGHSKKMFENSYGMVRQEDFDRAAGVTPSAQNSSDKDTQRVRL